MPPSPNKPTQDDVQADGPKYLTRRKHDEAERPGGCYISNGVVVDCNGNRIPGLVVIDGRIAEAPRA